MIAKRISKDLIRNVIDFYRSPKKFVRILIDFYKYSIDVVRISINFQRNFKRFLKNLANDLIGNLIDVHEDW